jgi:type VI secretion system protein ImpE
MGAGLNAQTLFAASELDDAIAALGAELRDNPQDVRRRTFLFELLCFAGQYDRAEKQLDVIAGASRDAEMGAWLYRSALHAERVRQEMFVAGAFPHGPPPAEAVHGTFNGRPFSSLADADPRIGARLEVFAAGQYTWIPFAHIASIQMDAPKRLRDLIWAPARIQTGPDFEGLELGEVLIPVLAPLSWQHPNGEVRLGRATEWVEEQDGMPIPAGQKLLFVDDEVFPILELRELVVANAPTE